MTPQNFVPPGVPAVPPQPVQTVPRPMPAPQKQRGLFLPIFISVIVTGALAGGGVYAWQQMTVQQQLDDATASLSATIVDQKSQLQDKDDALAEKDVMIGEKETKIDELEEEMKKGPGELTGKTFEEYVEKRTDYPVLDLTSLATAYTAEGIIVPCPEEPDGPCGFPLDVLSKPGWESTQGNQIFYFHEQAQTGDLYYGPFEDDLKKLIGEASAMVESMVVEGEENAMTPTSTQ